MGPRNPDEPLGEFLSLAFVLNRNFKESTTAGLELDLNGATDSA